MKKKMLMVLLGACMVCCTGFFAPGVLAAESILYQQNFDSTPVGEVPDEVECNISAALTAEGYVHVIEKADGKPDRALRSNHQTTAKGTNSATITLPEPVTGAFRLEADLKFGTTVKREFQMNLPNGKELFRIGMDTNKTTTMPNDKRLYARIGTTTTLLEDIAFEFNYKAEYHFTFDIDPEEQTVKLLVNGDGNRASTIIDISGVGIASEDIGLGSMKISTYYNGAVGSTNRFLQIDNIVVRQVAFQTDFSGNVTNASAAGNTEITVMVSLTDFAESAQPTLVYALYDDKGGLSKIDTDVYAAGAESGHTKTLTYDAPIPAGYSLEVFVWDAFDSLKPVGAKAKF